MPRSAGQSDFVVGPSESVDPVEVELPLQAGVVRLPRAQVRTNQAGATATRVVMTLTWIMLAILVLICLIGPHIPSGE